jgi:hypothetical protein
MERQAQWHSGPEAWSRSRSAARSATSSQEPLQEESGIAGGGSLKNYCVRASVN